MNIYVLIELSEVSFWSAIELRILHFERGTHIWFIIYLFLYVNGNIMNLCL